MMIKRLFLTLTAVACCLTCMAQFDEQNSLARKAIVTYAKDAKGFWQRTENVLVEKIEEGGSAYAF